MSEATSTVTTSNGTPVHAPSVVPEEGSRSGHHTSSQRPRKTSIHGSSGTWILGKTIGAGSMGKVKLARKSDGSEQVAVKIVPRQIIQERGIDPATGQPYPPRHDESKEVRTAREAAIVTLLDHPYICGMRDVIKTNNHWYMLCEYVNGGQMLDYIISHGRLKEKQARKFGRQIASALDYCHRNSIVHRDLKIENILISKTGDIKIIDFGLSNLFAPRSHLKTFCGSLYFAAPELLQAKQYIGPEVDVWSFGIVLYVLVCGKVPFDDQSMPALHAKIKRGVVDYPQWLSGDCRNLLARMLVTDPRQRASLQEILNHPWILKGFPGPPENHLPHREPLSGTLDAEVIRGMTGFEFGTSETIAAQLTKVIESEDYQTAVRNAAKEPLMASPSLEKRKAFGFEFYKRRSSTSSKDTLTNLSTEVLSHPSSPDPINAYNPLISVYYLVREKLERDSISKSPAGSQPPLPIPDVEKLRIPIPKQPEIAHTSETSYEVKGEPASTSGRTRPRARTHGDEEVSEAMKKVNLGGVSLPPSPVVPQSAIKEDSVVRKESTVGGMLRRFSTRRHNAKALAPPTLSVQAPGQAPVEIVAPRKSLSVRRPPTERQPAPSGASHSRAPDLLTPPTTADGLPGSKRSAKIGRSTSVSEVDWRRKYRGQHQSGDPPGTSGSDRSALSVKEETTQNEKGANSFSKPLTMRAKSLGHGRRENTARRTRREEAAAVTSVPNDVPEEDVGDGATSTGSGDGASTTPSSDFVRPVYLKGLFSVATTSTKSPVEIRMDIIRVLKELGVSYKEIKGGFSCVHRPSIDLKSVQENVPQSPEATNMVNPPSHRRKLSFGGSTSSSSAPAPPPPAMKGQGKRNRADTSYTNSDVSNESMHDGVLGGSLILNFEIYIVKVPLLSLHGIQFKSVSKTNTWQYKGLASRILQELRL
ncbi:Pkinase-domain-containing protein [Morchella conica CCBAS932]|uniref:non-specific serine/threonine protein kinase n=1 Tax=Morchella conica CCBAS932 TaxID=1392247 RepID=A0A3N4KR54_9PEZI|nr:Pkinase-domain-containing protein [Morchella conica CCBAS932]